MANRYTWRVTYRDGSDDSETGLGTFAKVRADCVSTCALWSTNRLRRSSEPVLTIHMPVGARAVFVRRSVQVIDLNTGKQQHKGIATVAGWEDANGSSYVFLLDKGGMMLSSDFHAV